MEMEMMMKRLEEASMEGNVTALLELIEKDPLILDRQVLGCYNETPLHISSMLGHLHFTNELLTRKPQLAIETSTPAKSTPLHLAAAKGYVEIVKSFLNVNPDVSFAVDKNGMNSSHVAAMKGKISVLKELVKVRASCAKVLIENGGEKESILQLCVKYDQFETFKFLVETIGGDDEVVNFKDSDGNTILHLAVADKQIQVIKYITSNTKVDVNAKNANGNTALDILAQSRRDVNDMPIYESLQLAGAIRTKHLFSPPNPPTRAEPNQNDQHITNLHYSDPVMEKLEKLFKKQNNWVEKKRNTLMVVASLIATMAFQAGVNPPGGVWQDDLQNIGDDNGLRSHRAGYSIMADNNQKYYRRYLVCNTASFVSSLSIILLLISGLPINKSFFMWLLMLTMWISLTAAGCTYAISLSVLTPSYESKQLKYVIDVTIYTWLGLMALLLAAHVVRIIVLILIQIFRCMRRCFGCCLRRSSPRRRDYGTV